MKFLVLFLAVASFAYGEVQVPDNHSAYGYLARSVELANVRREHESKISSPQGRIVGGLPASLGQLPYQAGLVIDILGFEGVGVCGASLLSANRLLTAAHCWFDGANQAWRFEVVLGSVFVFHGGVRQYTSVVINHPNWFPLLARNDIAIIVTPQTVQFNANISPIALPSGSELQEDFSGLSAIASGFGLTEDGGSLSPDQYLSQVRLNVITNRACRLGFPLVLQDTNICTSGIGNVGTCQGDSGGPLVITRNNKRILIGVTSFGHLLGCQIFFPAAFARVTSFVDFINQHL